MFKCNDRTIRTTIYIVNSNPDETAILHVLLARTHAYVVSCTSAEELLKLPFSTLKHSCLITDLHLSGIGGVELIEVLHQRGISIPVIVLADESDIPTAVRAMRAGALDFIDRPFSDRVLLNRVKQLLACRCTDGCTTADVSD
jgi:two-component system response regulator FixJ